jgi:hypothetical protein
MRRSVSVRQTPQLALDVPLRARVPPRHSVHKQEAAVSGRLGDSCVALATSSGGTFYFFLPVALEAALLLAPGTWPPRTSNVVFNVLTACF